MLQATHPPQPPNMQHKIHGMRRGTLGVNLRATPHATAETQNRTQNTEPLQGSLYAVGVARDVRSAKQEFGMSINQFDKHRNKFFDVIERVRFLDADGVMVNRIILDVRGLIVQIVAHDDSPRTVIVMIGEHVRMIQRAALIFIFLHLAKRSQA